MHEPQGRGVESGRYVPFPSSMDLGPYALLRLGRNAVLECFFCRDESICAVLLNSKTAVPSSFGQWVS